MPEPLSESEGMAMDLGSPQAETQRLAAIDASSALGRLADEVVLATLRWQREGNCTAEDRAAATKAATWLEELASLVEDPLDLPRSLHSLSKLDIIERFDQLRTDAAGATIDAGSLKQADTDRTAMAARFLKWHKLLLRFANNEASEAEVESIRKLFASLAEAMLSSVGDMLTWKPGAPWTTTFRS